MYTYMYIQVYIYLSIYIYISCTNFAEKQLKISSLTKLKYKNRY